jgi:hypothetical protein
MITNRIFPAYKQTRLLSSNLLNEVTTPTSTHALVDHHYVCTTSLIPGMDPRSPGIAHLLKERLIQSLCCSSLWLYGRSDKFSRSADTSTPYMYVTLNERNTVLNASSFHDPLHNRLSFALSIFRDWPSGASLGL